LFIFGGVFTSAILANIYKYGLNIISPELLLTLRTAWILLLLLLFKQVIISKKSFPIKALKLWFLSGFFYFIWHLARLYSIQELWLNLTILLLFLGPIFIFFFSFFILKEKVELKNIISSFLILLVVIVTIIY
jgi:drug/metabolite transporter (DMT)-like permease